MKRGAMMIINKDVKIGDNIFIGNNAIVLKGVVIGAGAVVAAGSVVSKSFSENSIIGGNPDKLIRRL